MAFGTPVVGTTAYSASGGTSVAPSYPSGITTTDQLVLIVGQKPSTANSGSVTTPTGWTLRVELTGAGGYGTTLGADTGNTNLRIYTKDDVTGSESGTLSVTLATNGVTWANITRVPTGGGGISYGSAEGQRTTTPTSPLSVALTDGSPTTAFEAGDFAIWAMCIPTDVTTPAQFSAHTITASGVTYNATAELVEPDSTTGNDIGGFVAYTTVATGSSSAAPTVGATLAGTLTNVRGPITLLRIREAPVYTLTGNSSDTDHTSTAGSIGQTHLLAGEGSDQATTSTTGAVETVAPAIDLLGNSAAQPNTTAAGSVVQTHLLAGNSARQGNTGSPGAVAQTHALAGASVVQPTTGTNGAAVQTQTMAGSGAAQPTTSTTGAAGQTHALTGASARQNTTATTGVVDLTFTHQLAANSAAQATTSTAAGVVQSHQLAGSSAAQPTTSTAGTVTTDNTVTLSGAGAAQATTATAGAVVQSHQITAGGAAQANTATAGAVSSEAVPVNLTGANAAQPTTSTTGAVVQAIQLQAAPVAVDHVATASAVVQAHILGGDYVQPGYVEPGYVLSASVVQRNRSTTGPVTQTLPPQFGPVSVEEPLYLARPARRSFEAADLRGDLRARPARRVFADNTVRGDLRARQAPRTWSTRQ